MCVYIYIYILYDSISLFCPPALSDGDWHLALELATLLLTVLHSLIYSFSALLTPKRCLGRLSCRCKPNYNTFASLTEVHLLGQNPVNKRVALKVPLWVRPFDDDSSVPILQTRILRMFRGFLRCVRISEHARCAQDVCPESSSGKNNVMPRSERETPNLQRQVARMRSTANTKQSPQRG